MGSLIQILHLLKSYSFEGLKIVGYLRKKLQENGFFDEAFGHRRKRSSAGKIGFHHRQVSPPGTEGRGRQMRRYQHLRKFLPQQVEIHGLPSQALLGQPQERTIPSQSPEPYPVQDHPRHVAPQAGPRTGRHEEIPRLRGNSRPLRQEKETRRSLGSPRPQAPASPQILRFGSSRPRGGMEIPTRHLDFGGQT